MIETLLIVGFICASCGTRYAERVGTCIRCWRSGVVIPDYQRQTDSLLPATCKKFSAKELASQDQSVATIGAYPTVKIQPNAFGIVHGGSHSGKTTMTLRIAESMQPSAYCAAEMRCGPSLSGYLRRLEIRAEKLMCFEAQSTAEIFEVAGTGVRILVLDSLTVLSLLPEDCMRLAKAHNIVVLGILQETKSGGAAGSNQWLHAADFIIKCDHLRWSLEKSRYQSLDGVGGEVL